MLSALIMLATLPLSAYLDPGAGWKIYKNINSPDSFSARITSKDSLSFMIVRCDGGADPVVSIQYVPIESVGISMGKVMLSEITASNTYNNFDLVWEPANTGTYTRDAVDKALVSEAVQKLRNSSHDFMITAFKRDGDAIEQVYENSRGNGLLSQILDTCADKAKKVQQ